MKTAVLLLTHFIDQNIIEKYKKLENEIGQEYDLYWVFQTDYGTHNESLLDKDVNLFTFNLDELNKLGYSPIFDKLYGSEHFIMEYFFHEHSEYDFYWGIEYDVIFTGNWNVLFKAFKDSAADLLSSHIERYREGENSSWDWWNFISFADEDRIDKSQYIKSFNPIYRISNRALTLLDSFLKKDKNGGFYELIMSTLLYHKGFKIVDFGGTGEFVQPGFKNKFYVQGKGINFGTMRWRPEFSNDEILALETTNKLFHPLKK
jgi:hypothetical protein